MVAVLFVPTIGIEPMCFTLCPLFAWSGEKNKKGWEDTRNVKQQTTCGYVHQSSSHR